MEYFRLLLNLHDGESADSGNAGQSAEGGSNQVSAQTRARAESLGVSDDLMESYNAAFGKKETESVQEENAQGEDFDSLIKGKYKNDYDSKVQSIVKDRVSKLKSQIDTMSKEKETSDRIVQLLQNKYPGVQKGDLNALLEAVEKDNDIFSQKALDNGQTVDEARNQWKNTVAQEQMEQELAQLRQQKAMQELDTRLRSQIPKVQELYPEFNFEEQMRNPEFTSALDFIAQRNEQSGTSGEVFDLVKAYEFSNFDKLRGQMASQVGKAAVNAVTQNIQAQRGRATENVSSRGTKTETKSVSQMSDKEFTDLLYRVKNGTANIPR